MTDTIPTDDADPAPKGETGVSDSARACPSCGESFTGPYHAGCSGDEKTTRESQLPISSSPSPTPAAPRRTSDPLPEEAAPHAQDPTRQMHQYILVRMIGKGGMGTVWKAWDRRLSRWVAIKFVLAEEQRGIERFEREAKMPRGSGIPTSRPSTRSAKRPHRRPGVRCLPIW
jgi:serine/threonine protein kinase